MGWSVFFPLMGYVYGTFPGGQTSAYDYGGMEHVEFFWEFMGNPIRICGNKWLCSWQFAHQKSNLLRNFRNMCMMCISFSWRYLLGMYIMGTFYGVVWYITNITSVYGINSKNLQDIWGATRDHHRIDWPEQSPVRSTWTWDPVVAWHSSNLSGPEKSPLHDPGRCTLGKVKFLRNISRSLDSWRFPVSSGWIKTTMMDTNAWCHKGMWCHMHRLGPWAWVKNWKAKNPFSRKRHPDLLVVDLNQSTEVHTITQKKRFQAAESM